MEEPYDTRSSLVSLSVSLSPRLGDSLVVFLLLCLSRSSHRSSHRICIVCLQCVICLPHFCSLYGVPGPVGVTCAPVSCHQPRCFSTAASLFLFPVVCSVAMKFLPPPPQHADSACLRYMHVCFLALRSAEPSIDFSLSVSGVKYHRFVVLHGLPVQYESVVPRGRPMATTPHVL